MIKTLKCGCVIESINNSNYIVSSCEKGYCELKKDKSRERSDEEITYENNEDIY